MTDNRKRKTHKIEEIEPGIWLYSDGAKRTADGRLVEKHPLAVPFTSEAASMLTHAKHEQAKEKAAEGLLRAVQANEPGVYNAPVEAWGKVVEKQAELSLAIDTGRDSTQAAKFVGRASGMMAERGQAPAADARTFVLNITDAAFARLTDVIDGEMHDVGEEDDD